jgi:hypothetical protein
VPIGLPSRDRLMKSLGLQQFITNTTIIYLYHQSLFKLQPQFDDVFRRILKQTPKSVLVLKVRCLFPMSYVLCASQWRLSALVFFFALALSARRSSTQKPRNDSCNEFVPACMTSYNKSSCFQSTKWPWYGIFVASSACSLVADRCCPCSPITGLH